MQARKAHFVLSSCGGILLLTGAAKLWSVISKEPVLESVDPVFGLTLRELFTYAGVIEAMVGLHCLLSVRLQRSAALVFWLSGVFVLYRIGLSWLGSDEPCGCLGALSFRWGLTPAGVDTVMKIVLGCMVSGSGAVLLLLRGKSQAVQ
jgi:hypothetical protein